MVKYVLIILLIVGVPFSGLFYLLSTKNSDANLVTETNTHVAQSAADKPERFSPRFAKDVPSGTIISIEDISDDTVMHIGDFLDPDSMDLSSNAVFVQHLGDYIDPDDLTEFTSTFETISLGIYLNPDVDENIIVSSSVLQEIGDYIDADALFLDFEVNSSTKVQHIGEYKDPENQ